MTDAADHTSSLQVAAPARRGFMLVLSSPSGAGKTTLSRQLLERHPDIRLSISATTRPPRPGERDGTDYHFVDRDEFLTRRDAGAFLEWAEVFGHFYATPKAPVMAALEAGADVLFDIDWQGAQQLGAADKGNLVSVFILPPNREELERRLRKRAQDPEDVVARRMREADSEMSHYAEYDYVIVNQELTTSYQRLEAILLAERQRQRRLVGLSDFVRELRAG
ncbi:MAG: guanylate kinase [Pseudomonadota bacterium]